jgi:hypothetical protein
LIIGGHRQRSQCRRYPTAISMSAISDIDICYSDTGEKYVGLKNTIPISEVFQYRHQSSFRYQTLKKKNILSCRFKPSPLRMVSERYNTKLLLLSVLIRMSDIGLNFIPISDIMSDIGSSDIRFSPISLITDIGLSAHL